MELPLIGGPTTTPPRERVVRQRIGRKQREPAGEATHCWHRNLHSQQQVADNHIDPSAFLGSLVINGTIRPYDTWAMLQDACSVLQAFSAAVFIGLLFHYCQSGYVSAASLLRIDMVMMGGLLVFGVLVTIDKGASAFLCCAAGLCSVMLVAAPFFRSCSWFLGEEAALNLSIGCMVLHVLTQDYGYINSYETMFTGYFSWYSAMLGSVLLASRLETDQEVLAFVLFAIEVGTTLPFIIHYLKQYEEVSLIVTLLSTCGIVVCLSFASKAFLTAYAALVLTLLYVYPFRINRWQNYKTVICGAWDEAVPGQPISR